MKRNLFGRIDKIISLLEKQAGPDTTFTFSNGKAITMRTKNVHNMFLSVIKGHPDENASFFLEQFKQGATDEHGLIHSLITYTPERIKQVWKEDQELKREWSE